MCIKRQYVINSKELYNCIKKWNLEINFVYNDKNQYSQKTKNLIDNSGNMKLDDYSKICLILYLRKLGYHYNCQPCDIESIIIKSRNLKMKNKVLEIKPKINQFIRELKISFYDDSNLLKELFFKNDNSYLFFNCLFISFINNYKTYKENHVNINKNMIFVLRKYFDLKMNSQNKNQPADPSIIKELIGFIGSRLFNQ